MADTSSQTKSNESAPPPLTRRNLKAFTLKKRKETARRRGRSTPSASPDFHSYCATMSSGLPSPIQRLERPRPTPAEVAADHDAWNKKLAMIPLSSPDFIIYPNEFESPAHSIDDENNQGPPEQITTAHQAPASGSNQDGDQPSPVGDYGTPPPVAHNHGFRLENGHGYPPGQYNDGYPPEPHGWGCAPPQPGLPTDRPTIPRQQPSVGLSGNSGPQFPTNFPAYHATQNMNEIAAYLANATYVVSLGGPPLADLKYGIVIVPAGQESLLFAPSAQSVINQDFVDAIDDANRDYDRALRMHDPNKDNGEFVRHRFDDDFAPVSAREQHNVETTLGNENGGADEHAREDDDDAATTDVGEPERKRPRWGPQRKSTRVTAHESGIARNNAASSGRTSNGAMDTAETQNEAKTKCSPSAAGREASPSKPAAKRRLR